MLDTTYQDIITNFLWNTMLDHVGMIWIIETHEQLQYDMDEQNSKWMTGSTWYNTSICEKLHGKLFEVFIINERTDRYNIMCSIDANEKLIHKNIIMESVVVVIHYHQIQQQNH